MLQRFSLSWLLSLKKMVTQSSRQSWKSRKQNRDHTTNRWLTVTTVDILPNVSLQRAGSTFSFELPPFIYHPSVRRKLQIQRCSCKFNFWHPQDCRGLSLDRNRLLFLFVPPRFRTTKHLPIKKKKTQWVYLEVGAIYRNLVNQAWINAGVAVDLEHFKMSSQKSAMLPMTEQNISHDRGKKAAWLYLRWINGNIFLLSGAINAFWICCCFWLENGSPSN